MAYMRTSRGLLFAQLVLAAVLGLGSTSLAGDSERPGPHSKSREMRFVPISAGSFLMGSPPEEAGRWVDETQHTVRLTSAFLISETEVTNAQFIELAQWALDQNPPLISVSASGVYESCNDSNYVLIDLGAADREISFDGTEFHVAPGKSNYPVKRVSWFGAVRLCDWLSLREELPRAYDQSGEWLCNAGEPHGALGYRLPTEAEWEYACRAGTQSAFYSGDQLVPGIDANCGLGLAESAATTEVGRFPPNPWGIYDMHGNVAEWCNDIYSLRYGDDHENPVGRSSGVLRVYRDEAWWVAVKHCRAAHRGNHHPAQVGKSFGIRVVKSVY